MYTLNKNDYELCDAIANRAMALNLYDDKLTCIMDISNAVKYFDMRLEEWLNADPYDFAHDIIGIGNAINRTSYPADFSNDPLFLPRFANGRRE